MHKDSTNTPIEVGDRVKFRGKEFTIKEFNDGKGLYGTAQIVFEEEVTHTKGIPDEISVDLVPHTHPLGQGDQRPQKGMWAPGIYICACSLCKKTFIGAKRALTCAECAYAPDRAVLHEGGVVTIDNVALPVAADLDFTTTEWDKIIEYYPEYQKHCLRLGVEAMDTLSYVLGFCRKLEEAKLTRDGKSRSAEDWFWRISDHFGRGWFNEKVLGSAAPYLAGF